MKNMVKIMVKVGYIHSMKEKVVICQPFCRNLEMWKLLAIFVTIDKVLHINVYQIGWK